MASAPEDDTTSTESRDTQRKAQDAADPQPNVLHDSLGESGRLELRRSKAKEERCRQACACKEWRGADECWQDEVRPDKGRLIAVEREEASQLGVRREKGRPCFAR